MSKIKISVIIPVFNTIQYINQCLDSVIKQTLEEIEIICIDNGSNDGSFERLKIYEKKYKSINVFKHEIGRQGAARNAGMKIAKGKYIGFVDSDDYIEPTMFEKMYNLAEKYSADLAICNIMNFFEKDNLYKINLPECWFLENEIIDFKINKKFYRNHTICNKLFKRSFIKNNKLKFPNDLQHEDVYFIIKAYLLAKKTVTIKDPLYIYRKQRLNSVNDQISKNYFMIFKIFDKIEKSIITNNSLINEIKIYKYLSLYQKIDKKNRRIFFNKMKDEFIIINLLKKLEIITPTEYKYFKIVNKYGFNLSDFLFYVKNQFGKLLDNKLFLKTYKKIFIK